MNRRRCSSKWRFLAIGAVLGCGGCTNSPNQGYLQSGHANFAAGMAEEAIDDFTSAIRQDPACLEAYAGRGCCYVIDRKYEKALNDFRHVEGRLPTTAVVLRYKGVALLEMNRAEESADVLTRALELEPTNVFALQNRALAREALGEWTMAVGDLDRAIELNPDSSDLYVDRAGIQLQLNHLDLALTDANRAVELCPDCPAAYMVRSQVHFSRYDLNLSHADGERAFQLAPSLRRTLRGAVTPRRPLVGEHRPTVVEGTG